VFVLLGRFVALLELPEGRVMAALLAGHTVSRFCAATLLCWLDYVRKDALAKAKSLATKMTLVDLGIAGLIAFFPCLLLPLENLFWGFCLAALTTFGLARFFRRRIGGYTGDCLGATQQAAELAFYLGLLAHWPSG
jgi:adenosylcobinamide-GDP ribazoletransferase